MTWNWNNLSTIHHRWMMRYLRKRGWVVFYLEPQCRRCHIHPPPFSPLTHDSDGSFTAREDNCWLALYEKGNCR